MSIAHETTSHKQHWFTVKGKAKHIRAALRSTRVFSLQPCVCHCGHYALDGLCADVRRDLDAWAKEKAMGR